MSLEQYRRSRLVVQRPTTTVHDAARAMESNHVGAIVVHEHGRIVGMVTDRDLTVRVVGYGRDPRTTTLREVMSTDVATLPIEADEAEAMDLMQRRRIRRLPVLEAGKLVGMVTADDLLSGAAAEREPAQRMARLAMVIRPQIERTVSTEERLAHRHAARAEETFATLLHRVQGITGLPTRKEAATALELVLTGIVCRITPNEAANLISQLPSALHQRLLDLPAGPDKGITRGSIESELAERLHLSPEQSSQLLSDVGQLLGQTISAGEIEDVKGQLPKDMRTIFRAKAHAPSPSA